MTANPGHTPPRIALLGTQAAPPFVFRDTAGSYHLQVLISQHGLPHAHPVLATWHLGPDGAEFATRRAQRITGAGDVLVRGAGINDGKHRGAAVYVLGHVDCIDLAAALFPAPRATPPTVTPEADHAH